MVHLLYLNFQKDRLCLQAIIILIIIIIIIIISSSAILDLINMYFNSSMTIIY